ncbi:hypothetical protein C5167_015836 [Papaver somniferum]|uniref:Uncharacterized protein n=1 Tax=Papaver somniferum TaxID=3469 RepID=A0A4Y7JA94_PAPSO|nr:hypothetical protein C5167_015836 [Papaver somniferum]
MDENKFKNLATAVSNIGTKQDGLQKEVSNMITGFKKDMKDFCAAFISRLNQLAKNGGKIYDDASNCSNVNQNHVVQNIQNVETEDHRMVLQYIHKEDDVQNIDIVDTEDRRMGSKEIHKYGKLWVINMREDIVVDLELHFHSIFSKEMEEVEIQASQPGSDIVLQGRHDAFSQVRGRDKGGRVRCLGNGIKPKKY